MLVSGSVEFWHPTILVYISKVVSIASGGHLEAQGPAPRMDNQMASKMETGLHGGLYEL